MLRHPRNQRLALILLAALPLWLWWMLRNPLADAAPAALRIAVGPWIGYEPLVLARERGALDGAYVVIETGSNSETLDALQDGRVDLAGLTLDESLRLAREGFPHTIIAVLSDSHGGDAVVTRPGLGGIAALRGQTVLVEDSAVGRFVLARGLADAGLALSDVHIQHVQATRLALAWRRGEAAGAVAYSPVLQALEAEGAEVVFSTRDHPGLVYDVLVAREGALGDQAQLQRLLDALDVSVGLLQRADGEAIALLAPGLDVDAQQYREALSQVSLFTAAESRELLEGDSAALARALEGLMPHVQDGAFVVDADARPRLNVQLGSAL